MKERERERERGREPHSLCLFPSLPSPAFRAKKSWETDGDVKRSTRHVGSHQERRRPLGRSSVRRPKQKENKALDLLPARQFT